MPVPPEPVTGVKEAVAVPCVSVFVAIAWVATTAPLTVRVKLAVAEAPLASVTVTVWTTAVSVAVGVPVIAPVAEAIDRPVGRLGDTL